MMVGVVVLIGALVWAVVTATTRGAGVRSAPEASAVGGRERPRADPAGAGRAVRPR